MRGETSPPFFHHQICVLRRACGSGGPVQPITADQEIGIVEKAASCCVLRWFCILCSMKPLFFSFEPRHVSCLNPGQLRDHASMASMTAAGMTCATIHQCAALSQCTYCNDCDRDDLRRQRGSQREKHLSYLTNRSRAGAKPAWKHAVQGTFAN